MKNHITIGSVEIPTNEFAVAGTAFLGIRKSGKTYGAKGVAEQLITQGIPIIVFDAIGVWRFLKTPADESGKGFEVVVAGGEASDIPLTPQNVSEIIRAAMRSNVSLVIDLYHPNLSKSDWRKIVQSGFHTLLYENKKFGHRYIILEEAAEYIPQRISDGETFAAVEKVGRMGGNVGLGLMLLNQRSQEINKTVLDLCDNLVLMRQRGSAAIDAVQKWMDKVDPATANKITKSLPNMKSGDCWVWAENNELPVETRTHHIKSFHPDRTKQADSVKSRKTVDTSEFIAKLWREIPKIETEKKNADPEELRKRIRDLERQLKQQPVATKVEETIKEIPFFSDAERKILVDVQKAVAGVGISIEKSIADLIAQLFKIEKVAMTHRPFIPAKTAPRTVAWVRDPKPKPVHIEANGSTVAPVEQRILNSIAELELLSVEKPVREMVALMSNYTNLKSDGFVKAMSALRTKGLVDYPNSDTVAMTANGRAVAVYPPAPRSSEEIQRRVSDLIGGKASQILNVLISNYPDAVARADVAAAADYTNLKSDGFVKIVSRLRTLGFVDYPDTQTMKATDVLFLK